MRRRTGAVLAVLALVGAACGDDGGLAARLDAEVAVQSPSTTTTMPEPAAEELAVVQSQIVSFSDGSTVSLSISTGTARPFGVDASWEADSSLCAVTLDRDAYLPVEWRIENTTEGFGTPLTLYGMRFQQTDRSVRSLEGWQEGDGCDADDSVAGGQRQRDTTFTEYVALTDGGVVEGRGIVILANFYTPNDPDGRFSESGFQLEYQTFLNNGANIVGPTESVWLGGPGPGSDEPEPEPELEPEPEPEPELEPEPEPPVQDELELLPPVGGDPAAPREPVALSMGNPSTCDVQVATGGILADLGDLATGFDIALARELTDRVYGPVEICFVGFTAAERFTLLPTVDFMVRGTTATTSRDELGDFTSPYFLDGMTAATRGIAVEEAADLAGLDVAITANLSSSSTAADYLAAAQVTTVEFETLDASIAAFEAGTVDAVISDWSALRSRLSDPDVVLSFLGETIEPLAVFVAEGEVARRDVLDAALRAMVADGAWRSIFDAEIGGDPWFVIEDVLALPPVDR